VHSYGNSFIYRELEIFKQRRGLIDKERESNINLQLIEGNKKEVALERNKQ